MAGCNALFNSIVEALNQQPPAGQKQLALGVLTVSYATSLVESFSGMLHYGNNMVSFSSDSIYDLTAGNPQQIADEQKTLIVTVSSNWVVSVDRGSLLVNYSFNADCTFAAGMFAGFVNIPTGRVPFHPLQGPPPAAIANWAVVCVAVTISNYIPIQ
jgi:hypothetical protein